MLNAYVLERYAKASKDHVDRESSPAAIVDHAAFTLARTHIHTRARSGAGGGWCWSAFAGGTG